MMTITQAIDALKQFAKPYEAFSTLIPILETLESQETEIAKFQRQKAQVQKEIAQKEAESTALTDEMNALRTSRDQAKAETLEAQKALQVKSKELDSASAQVKAKLDELDAVMITIAGKEKDQDELEKQIKLQETRLGEVQGLFDQTRKDLSNLKTLLK